jgi:hypothetical protein
MFIVATWGSTNAETGQYFTTKGAAIALAHRLHKQDQHARRVLTWPDLVQVWRIDAGPVKKGVDKPRSGLTIVRPEETT